MIAHVFRKGGRLHWSGYRASGDPRHEPYFARVELGRDFWLGDDGRLHYVLSGQTVSYTPDGLILAAIEGMFGLRLIPDPSRVSCPVSRVSCLPQKQGLLFDPAGGRGPYGGGP